MTSAKVYWIGYLIPCSVLAAYVFGGPFYWTSVVLGFLLVPLFDYLFGKDCSNPSIVEELRLKESSAFSWPLLIYAPTFLILVAFGAYWYASHNLQTFEQVGLILSTGIAGGLGITVAHELCHRNQLRSKAAGFFLLSLVSYAHFGIEHVVGHHSRVATPDDPTSARFGETAYRFVVRSIVGSFLSVYRFEKRRVAKRGHGAWSLHNRIVACVAAPVIIATVLGSLFGARAVVFYLSQSAVAIILLELTNYIEHYGLQRKRLANGKWEKVTPLHSWNADQRLSNLFLFKLQRHADHHANPQRPYQILRHFHESPELPFGYPTMILIALVPPLWKAVMDKRVLSIQERAIGLMA